MQVKNNNNNDNKNKISLPWLHVLRGSEKENVLK
jgi:hypothetical protein